MVTEIVYFCNPSVKSGGNVGPTVLGSYTNCRKQTTVIQCQNGVVGGGFRSQSTIQQALLTEYTCHIKYTLALGYFGYLLL